MRDDNRVTHQQVSKKTEFRRETHYDSLEVKPDAGASEIRFAYRLLAEKYHPGNSETGDLKIFRDITEAFRVLSDEGRRLEYDRSIGLAGEDDDFARIFAKNPIFAVQ